MSTLHLVTNPGSAESCLSMHSFKEDTILFLLDGVYASEQLQVPRTFAIQRDVVTRGLSDSISDDITLINYEEFVALVVEHESIITWR